MLTFYLSIREGKYANQIRPNHRMLNKSNSNFQILFEAKFNMFGEVHVLGKSPHGELFAVFG